MKTILILIATCIGFVSCQKDMPKTITGEVLGVSVRILSDSLPITVFSIDAKEDGKKRSTVEMAVDPKIPENAKIITELMSMAKYNFYQPLFVRFSLQEADSYVATETAKMNYEISGTPPVYVFASDAHIATN